MEDGDHVPPYYRDQMLLLMEVLNLDHAYYMEWKPETSWSPEEVGVTVVHRDRAWFAEALPRLREFHEEMTRLRALPREQLEARFPRRQPRPVYLKPPKPAPVFRFRPRPVAGLPSGAPDEFFDGPPDMYSSISRQRDLDDCELAESESDDEAPPVTDPDSE